MRVDERLMHGYLDLHCSGKKSNMKPNSDHGPSENALFVRVDTLPTQERVVDRLADLMLGADEVLDMLRARDASQIRWLEPHVRGLYDEVNELMKRLCD